MLVVSAHRGFGGPSPSRLDFPELPAPFSELPALLRIYMGLLDGEAQVERDLREIRDLLEIHSGPVADETLDNVLMIRLSGPVNPGDIATPACGGGLLPTAFTKACAGLWRQLYGARVNSAPGRLQLRGGGQKGEWVQAGGAGSGACSSGPRAADQ